MSSHTSLAELRQMSVSDLRREIVEKRALVSKMRLGIAIQKEKDTSRYQREKKELARLLTVLHEKEAEATLPRRGVAKGEADSTQT